MAKIRDVGNGVHSAKTVSTQCMDNANATLRIIKCLRASALGQFCSNSHLEYCVSEWTPQPEKNILELEKCMKRVTKPLRRSNYPSGERAW